MSDSKETFKQGARTWKPSERPRLILGDAWLELPDVEIVQERERLLYAILLIFGMAACGLLVAMLLAAAIVVLVWPLSPAAVLLTLSGIYGSFGLFFGIRIRHLLRGWQASQIQNGKTESENGFVEKASNGVGKSNGSGF